MFSRHRKKRVRLSQRDRTLIRNALHCQAIQLETSSERYGNDNGGGLLAAWDMQSLAKRIPW
jgi:hypothetical protein